MSSKRQQVTSVVGIDSTLGNEHARKIGYAEFSEWMAKAEDFTLFRRFEALNTRIILQLQDRVIRKEKDLAKLDKALRNSGENNTQSDSFRHDPSPDRKKILTDLRVLLEEYSSLPKPLKI
jgi:hypothetical protein